MEPEIGEPIASHLEHDDGSRERDNVLLKGQVPIRCYEHVELRWRESEQLSILERRPPHLTRGPHLVAIGLAAEAPVDTLVEQHPHETVSISRSFASSRNQ